MEQQEELWIVHAEGRVGREWDLADPGKHRPYSHEYPPYSPSKVIGMLHRWRNRPWTEQEWRLARAIAGNRSLRLPVLMAQAFLRRHTMLARRRGVEMKMERYLGDTKEWKFRLSELERQTGIAEADIKQWLWILSPSNGDTKIHRFLASNCRKPLFLLQLLLAKDKRIEEPATFLGLLQYIRENYVHAERPQDELEHTTYKDQGRSMTWHHYLVFLYRLVWHCRQGWPAAMPLLARLTTEYIGTMRLDSRARAMTGYQARSIVLNKSLEYLSWPARIRPLDHMEHNWAAQRHLLQLAAATEPPLVMDQKGYRAVRSVLIALPKSKVESKNADRVALTWPPYRRTLDGIDERRNREDDLSRSAKAGMLVSEAGYNDDVVDRALSALGGSTFGQPPTIQTRSLAPIFFSGRRASSNIFVEWAAHVRATRNAREAWMVFEIPPEPGLRPNAEVYGEMLDKLYAQPVTQSPAIRPGDAKEAFPLFNGNLSQFEIARLTPPTPTELYDLMTVRDKVRPDKKALVILVKNASSKAEALRYLSDSRFENYIEALREPVSNADSKSLMALARLPLPIFNAWISMLCRVHTRPRQASGAMDDPRAPPDPKPGARQHRAYTPALVAQRGSIQEAIALVTAFHRENIRSAYRDAHSWHIIMEALAGRKMLHSRLGAEFNVLETLATFLDIFERTTASRGANPVTFEALCVMIRKALKLSTFQQGEFGKMTQRPHISGKSAIEKLLLKSHRYAVRMFEAITAPIPVEMDEPEMEEGEENDTEAIEMEDAEAEGDEQELDDRGPGMSRYNVVGRPAYKYMMALACCGDHQGMVRLIDWLLDGWDHPYIREGAKMTYSVDYYYTMRTIAYFAEAGRELVPPAEMERLKKRLWDMRWEKGCSWFWPDEASREERRSLPELETDLVVFEHWTQLREMVNRQDPGQRRVAATTEPCGAGHEMPAQFLERDQDERGEQDQGRDWELAHHETTRGAMRGAS
jgi:DNA (cytosine-5)-methyltransferase 1